MGAIIIWDGATCPSGYTRFTAADAKFPRGSAVAGGLGGGDTDTVTGNVGDTSLPEANQARTHNHSVLPPYVDFLFCEAASDIVSLMPTSAIFLWEDSGSCPAGSTRVSVLDNKFPRGAATPGGTGGSTTTGAASSTAALYDSGVNSGTVIDHTHTAWPAYYNFLFCKKD